MSRRFGLKRLSAGSLKSLIIRPPHPPRGLTILPKIYPVFGLNSPTIGPVARSYRRAATLFYDF